MVRTYRGGQPTSTLRKVLSVVTVSMSAAGAHPPASVRPTDARHREEHLVAEQLIIRGAREHNLKDVSLDLPRDSMIVFTGLSGSGKSSLAFDTIFAEGQRRYVE